MEQIERKRRMRIRKRKRIIRRMVIWVYRCICAGVVAAIMILVVKLLPGIVSIVGDDKLFEETFVSSAREENLQEEYPQSLLELLERNPETKDFVLNYPTNKDTDFEIDLSDELTDGTIPLFLQWDVRWGYETYGSDLMAITGCGPTCLSMVRCGLSGEDEWNPLEVANMAEEYGFYVEGAGTSWDLMTTGAIQLGLTKILGLQTILVENSGIHYLVVCVISVMVSYLFYRMKNKVKGKIEDECVKKSRAWLEINLNNLSHNVEVLNKILPEKCELMTVVKAKAYGHGAYEVATHINRLGVKAFAVATIDEEIELRHYGIIGEILILGYTAPTRAKELHKYDLTQILIDYEYACMLEMQGYYVKGHIKIDTGMHRLGFACADIEEIENAFSMKHIKVCGILTHLCSADNLSESEQSYTRRQIVDFYDLIENLKKKGITIPKIHIQSSYGLLNYPELKCDYVRVGISLYGVSSAFNDETKQKLDLRPVLALKTRVILLRDIEEGESVGYSRTFVSERRSKIAVLPIGYADGYPRNLSGGKSYVLINGKRAPIVGRICMDQLAVDVTDIHDVKVGMIAILIGKDGEEEIQAPMVAEAAGSISNELLCRMGERLECVIVERNGSI